MEYCNLPNIEQKVSRVGLGTWAIGGSMWGGSDEKSSIATIHSALDKGINLIDTAPAYGFGVSEEVVGKALKQYGKRDEIIIATKQGLTWKGKESVFCDGRKQAVAREIEESLKRLQVDYIDLYQVHWPDLLTPIEETAEALSDLLKQGKIRAIGVCNYSIGQIEAFRKKAPLHTLQAPYNLFERQIEDQQLAYSKKNQIAVLGYCSLCRGLLTPTIKKRKEELKGDDLRKSDPKFLEPHFSEYLTCLLRLTNFAKQRNKTTISLAIRWALDKGISVALWGARKPEQLKEIDSIWGWKISDDEMQEIDELIEETVLHPAPFAIGAPPKRT